MDLRCQVCGRQEKVGKWQPSFEQAKEGRTPPYICQACQDRIRADANHLR